MQNCSYNGYNEVDGSVSSVAGANVYSWSVPARDNAGRILRREENIDGTTVVWEYSYNLVGRLMQVKRDGVVVESYTYDANGNRLTEANSLRGISLQSYGLSVEDHVLNAGSDVYQFDINGYLMSKTTEDGITSYAYSSRGELLRVDKPDGTILSYINDPFGRRIAKQINGTTVEKYLWAGQTTLLAVYDGNNNLRQRFTYADARMPVSMTAGGATYFLLTDQVGTLRAVADSTGTIVKRVDYDSFGNIIADSNPSFSVPFGFAGGLHDRDTGLVRFGYRDYSPELGRFVAKDPIDFAGGDTNLYAYAMSDPINWIDPLGLDDWPGSWDNGIVRNDSGRDIILVDMDNTNVTHLPDGGTSCKNTDNDFVVDSDRMTKIGPNYLSLDRGGNTHFLTTDLFPGHEPGPANEAEKRAIQAICRNCHVR